MNDTRLTLSDVKGPFKDLLDKLGGEEGEEWLEALNKMLRKENSWPRPILKLISSDEELTLDACDSERTIAQATDVFAHIDSNFKNWGTDKAGKARPRTLVKVFKMQQNANFAQMFTFLADDVNLLCLEQEQIIQFARKRRNWLRKDGFATFFLFKVSSQFLVAYVYLYSDGGLRVSIYRFGDDFVWATGRRLRVVVPA